MCEITNDEKLFELIKAIVVDFIAGNYYLMNHDYTEIGSERWVSDATLGDPKLFRGYEIYVLTSISLEHLWRMINHEDLIFSRILMPKILYKSYLQTAVDKKSSNGLYSEINCEFLKEYSKKEFAKAVFEMIEIILDSIDLKFNLN